jgi:hypothetical protein
VRARSGEENPLHADLLEPGDVDVRDDPADHHQDIVEPFFFQKLHQPWRDVVVGARQDRQADDVGVLLQRGRGNLLRRLPQAGVDDFHAGIAKRPGDHFGAAIVPVEARLRDHHSQFAQTLTLRQKRSPERLALGR